MAVVEQAVQLITDSEQTRGLSGYRADFVLARQPGTLEHGYVAGRYDDFPVLVVARFASLQASKVKPPQ